MYQLKLYQREKENRTALFFSIFELLPHLILILSFASLQDALVVAADDL
ncbi:hypothetical protein GEI7407_1982 [Geitlerinema sp. PCC 7407]|nr:hypothetical protein GEI7407_1982 [Geitlerinema sp. PCC 7407]